MKIELASNCAVPHRPEAEKLSREYRRWISDDELLRKLTDHLSDPSPELESILDGARQDVFEFMRNKKLSEAAEKFAGNPPEMKIFENYGGAPLAIYFQNFHQIWVRKDLSQAVDASDSRYELSRFIGRMALIHENLHAASANISTVTAARTEKGAVNTRCGYYLKKIDLRLTEEDGLELSLGSEKFEPFNEGLTELIAMEAAELSLSESEIYFRVSPYSDFMLLAHKIRYTAYADNPDLLVEEYFRGGLQHLRRIDKFYGPNALRWLTELQSEKKIISKYEEMGERVKSVFEKIALLNKFNEEEFRNQAIFRFFMTDDDEERELCRQLLSAGR